MKFSISRSSILTVLAVTILLTALPGEIRRLIQTHEPYLFTRHFFEDMLARLSGPGRLRFMLQPVTAILLGIPDGARDARLGSPPFLAALVSSGARRLGLLRSAVSCLRDLLAIVINPGRHLAVTNPSRSTCWCRIVAGLRAGRNALCGIQGFDKSDCAQTDSVIACLCPIRI